MKAHHVDIADRITQRQVYFGSRLTRLYWDFKDGLQLRALPRAGLVVDFGCGEGITLARMVRELAPARVIGCDGDHYAAAVARREEGRPIFEVDLRRIPLPDASVDAALLSDVIEHIVEWDQVLDELTRVIRPGGILVLMFPNDLPWIIGRAVLFKWELLRQGMGHVKQWSPRDMGRELERRGFRLRHARNLPLRLPWPLAMHHLITAERGTPSNTPTRAA